MAGNKRRFVLITHPSFDMPGRDGPEAAKMFATQLIEGQTQLIETAIAQGAPEAQVEAIRQYVDDMAVIIRNVEEDII
jgi:hypothetical protein